MKRLKKRFAIMTEENGVLLKSSLHSDFSEIMNEMTNNIHIECADNSFKRILYLGTNSFKPSKQRIKGKYDGILPLSNGVSISSTYLLVPTMHYVKLV